MYIIEVEDQEVLEFMKSVFKGSAQKVEDGTSQFEADVQLKIQAGYEVLCSAKKVKEPKVKDEYVPNLCKTHPKYKAAQVPRIDCDGCWAAYKKFHPTEYTRKRRDFKRKQNTRT